MHHLGEGQFKQDLSILVGNLEDMTRGIDPKTAAALARRVDNGDDLLRLRTSSVH